MAEGPVTAGPRWSHAAIFEWRGLWAWTAFAAGLCFAGQTICVKLMRDVLPVAEVVCLRFVLQGVFCTMFGMFSSDASFTPRSKRETALLSARGTVGSIAIGLLYFAVYNIPAATVNAIVFGAPVFVAIFAWLLLREKLYRCDVLLVVVNIVGVLLVAQPPFLFPSESLSSSKEMELVGVAAAVVAMLLSAMTSILIRLLGLMGTGAVKIVFFYSLWGSALPLSLGIMMQDWIIPPCGSVRFILVALGLLNFLAQSLISFSFAASKQSYFVSTIISNQVPVTVLLEFIILGNAPDWISGIGMCVVVFSAVGVVLREKSLLTRQQTSRESSMQEAGNI